MVRTKIAIWSAAAALSAQANAATWVQYDLYGSGSYSSVDVSTDPSQWEAGHARFSGTFFVEIDPTGLDDWLDYYSDGMSFDQWDWNDPTLFYGVSAGKGALSISYGYNDGDCGHYFCEDAEIALKFAPGSFDGLPPSLPHLQSGTIGLSQSAHWWGLDASGSVWTVTAKTVSAPGQSWFDVTTIPTGAPEPTSWAMMLSGFGLIGGALRVRQRTAIGFG